MAGRTIAVYGDTGSGKTSQIGELAKALFKARRFRTLLRAADRGGCRQLRPMEKLGFLIVEAMEESSDPWVWLNEGVSKKPEDDIGLIAFDSATSLGEMILNHITKSSQKVGQQNTQKFNVGSGLMVGLNNESHYGLVQSFMLEQMWKSTWLTLKGAQPDILWTFGLDRDEKVDRSLVVGPKVAGHALTSQVPKWFNYCFRLVSVPVPGEPARHLLYTQEQPDINGMGVSFGNPRYPLDASSVLPAVIEPASIAEALRLIEQGEVEAEENLKREMDL